MDDSFYSLGNFVFDYAIIIMGKCSVPTAH